MTQKISKIVQYYNQYGLSSTVCTGIEYAIYNIIKNLPYSERIKTRYFYLIRSHDVDRYDHPPDPFKIVWVSPDRITHWTGRDDRYDNRRKLFGKVRQGNWDLNTESFLEGRFHQSLKSHFELGVPWEETPQYHATIRRLRNGNINEEEFSNVEDVIERYSQIDELYEAIKNKGYLPQPEIHSDTTSGFYPSTMDEVSVDVGRNGQLLLADGMHRLSIAILLEIESIPIVFFVRHSKWMKYRDSIAKKRQSSNHPDLRDL